MALGGDIMALIKCRECGNNISDKSKACPRCGCPTSYSIDSERAPGESECSYTETDKMRDGITALLLMAIFGAIYFALTHL
jgi:uncharacterized membrane protein YvbJ